MLVPERKTKDGFEEHFCVNYLGHFLLTNLLLKTLKQSGTHSHGARIVVLSSATHYVGELHLDDLQSRYKITFAILVYHMSTQIKTTCLNYALPHVERTSSHIVHLTVFHICITPFPQKDLGRIFRFTLF